MEGFESYGVVENKVKRVMRNNGFWEVKGLKNRAKGS